MNLSIIFWLHVLVQYIAIPGEKIWRRSCLWTAWSHTDTSLDTAIKEE